MFLIKGTIMKRILIVAVLLSSSFTANATVMNTDLCLRDCKMELQFFRRYAQQGSSIAKLALAIMNYRGQGKKIDIDAGNSYLVKAARAGEPVAQYQLGYFLMHGIYMKKDLRRSLSWFKKSSRYNILDSQELVARLTETLNEYEAPTMTLAQASSHFIVGDLVDKTDISTSAAKKAIYHESSAPIADRITITAAFNWADVLDAAQRQTCNNPSCKTTFMRKALIPRIILKNDHTKL